MACIFCLALKRIMHNSNDPKRNKPADEGRNDDPNVRDESAFQPGMNTVSSSDYDDDNEKLSRTAADNFREDSEGDEKADPTFDEDKKD